MAFHVTKEEWKEIENTGNLPDRSKYEINKRVHKEIVDTYKLPFGATEKIGIRFRVKVQLPETKSEFLAGVVPYKAVTERCGRYMNGFDKIKDDGLLEGIVYVVPGIALPKHMKPTDVGRISEKLLQTDTNLSQNIQKEVIDGHFETIPLIVNGRPDTVLAGENPHHSSINLLLRPKESLIRYECKIRQALPVINNNSAMLYLINIGYVADNESANIIAEKLKDKTCKVAVEEKTVEKLFEIK